MKAKKDTDLLTDGLTDGLSGKKMRKKRRQAFSYKKEFPSKNCVKKCKKLGLNYVKSWD